MDIIALRENGLWDLNSVAVEILKQNKETQLLQKEKVKSDYIILHISDYIILKLIMKEIKLLVFHIM